MRIWIARHGQTDLNRKKRMQGLTDVPLNETGRAQAAAMHELTAGTAFAAVYASPLCRAVETAALIAGVGENAVIRDRRLIEVDFGRYEGKKYSRLGLKMTSYWLLPEYLPAPVTVENTSSMIRRSRSFLRELEEKYAGQEDADILIVCHGGIIRALRGYMEDRKNGLRWRPKPRNCEILVYESDGGCRRLLRKIGLK